MGRRLEGGATGGGNGCGRGRAHVVSVEWVGTTGSPAFWTRAWLAARRVWVDRTGRRGSARCGPGCLVESAERPASKGRRRRVKGAGRWRGGGETRRGQLWASASARGERWVCGYVWGLTLVVDPDSVCGPARACRPGQAAGSRQQGCGRGGGIGCARARSLSNRLAGTVGGLPGL